MLWHRLPERVRPSCLPAAAAGAALVAGGALLAGGTLAVHHGQAGDLTAGLDAGVGGGLLLLLGCLFYLPTAVVWGLAFCVGPGFAVGEGTSVGVLGADLGAVPAVPLLAGLPSGTGSPAWWLVLLVPAAAGVLAGLVADRTAGTLAGAGPRRPGASSPRPRQASARPWGWVWRSSAGSRRARSAPAGWR